VPDLDLVPRPTRLAVHDGRYTLTPRTRLRAPSPIADLVRELVHPFPEGEQPGLTFAVVDDAELGAEGYRLAIGADGVRVTGSETGLRWAVQTLLQLLPPEFRDPHAAEGRIDAQWPLPYVDIVDVPRYPWRGCLLDVARWCHPIEFLHRYVDLLAMHKLNTLHLHLTDDQGWRFEVHRYPLLTEVGGFRRESNRGHARYRRFDGTPHGGWYSQAQLRELVGYAARRGVRIMPEIDVPGHTQAAIAAYPELGNEPERRLEVRTSWGISSHILNVADSTVRFVKDVLDEVVDVFPFELVHLGGDEVPPDEWAGSTLAAARVRSAGLSTVDDLLGWWAGELAAHVAGHGRRVAVWDEVLEYEPPRGAVIFAWRDESRVAAARKAGFEVVAVPQEYAYLDWAESNRPDEPLAINGTLPLAQVYGYQPGDVQGVQGQVWSEYLPTPDLVEWRAFPRLAALAEVGWTAQRQPFPEFRQRLRGHLRRLDAFGVHYRPLD
jgi:hexosaminidase